MTTDELMADLAKRNRAWFDSDEGKRVLQAWSSKTATVDDMLAFAEAELRDCLDSLEPHAPGNGRHVDGWHAGCDALRALVAVMKAREHGRAQLAAAEKERDEARGEWSRLLDEKSRTERLLLDQRDAERTARETAQAEAAAMRRVLERAPDAWADFNTVECWRLVQKDALDSDAGRPFLALLDAARATLDKFGDEYEGRLAKLRAAVAAIDGGGK